MIGDKYQIFYSEDGHSVLVDTVDSWHAAKAIRGNAFYQNKKARAAWIMRGNPALELPPRRYGVTLRRTRHEVA